MRLSGCSRWWWPFPWWRVHGGTRFQGAGPAAGDGISAGGRSAARADLRARRRDPGRWWELFRSRASERPDRAGHPAQRRPPGGRSGRARRAGQRAGAARGTVPAGRRRTGIRRGQKVPTQTLDSNAASGAKIYSLHTAQVTVAYVADVWGGRDGRSKVAGGAGRNQAFQREGVYLTLTSNIALAAIQEASLRGQIAATRRLIALQTQLLDILRRQNSAGPDRAARRGGAGNRGRPGAAAAAAAGKAARPAAQPARRPHRPLPERGRRRQPSSSRSFRLPRKLPLSLPADLVRQRPDVRAAEANVHAANAQIGVAIANRLPQITLTGKRRQHAPTRSRTCSRPAPLSGRSPATLLQPVFDGGTLAIQAESRRGSLAQARRAVSQHRADRLPERRRRAARPAGRCARARGGDRRRAARRTRSIDLVRRQVEQGQVSLPSPAHRAAGLSADVACARAGAGRPAGRHRRAVPGARRRLVEQVEAQWSRPNEHHRLKASPRLMRDEISRSA